MPAVSHREPIEAPADAVWSVVREFGDDSWTGVTITCEGEGVGAVRTVGMPTGDVVERCDLLEPERCVIGYEILSGNPFPVTDYHGRIAVEPTGAATSDLVWSATYETVDDPDGVAEGLRRFRRASARALKRHVEPDDG